jgi:hypothetical protein
MLEWTGWTSQFRDVIKFRRGIAPITRQSRAPALRQSWET